MEHLPKKERGNQSPYTCTLRRYGVMETAEGNGTGGWIGLGFGGKMRALTLTERAPGPTVSGNACEGAWWLV
jgi:hypothetical protein